MRRIGPGWRIWGLTLTITIIAALVSIYSSVRIADYNTQQAITRAEAARVEQHRVACDLVVRILAGYEEAPPTSAAGKNVVEAWREEYRVLGCQPKR